LNLSEGHKFIQQVLSDDKIDKLRFEKKKLIKENLSTYLLHKPEYKTNKFLRSKLKSNLKG